MVGGVCVLSVVSVRLVIWRVLRAVKCLIQSLYYAVHLTFTEYVFCSV